MANASRSAQMAQLAQARQGDEAALAGIIARMMPVVNAAAARAVCPGLEFEDAVQEGLVGLFCAVRTYKGGAGTAFSTYAAACVRNAVNSAARAASRRKHEVLNRAMPIEAAPSTQAKSPQACAEESEAYRAAVRTIHTRLSPREKSVGPFMAGASYGQIARRLHLTPKAVDNALQRVRAKLKIGSMAPYGAGNICAPVA